MYADVFGNIHEQLPMSRGQIVLTYDHIAAIHGIDPATVRAAYLEEKSRFDDGVDTWIVEGLDSPKRLRVFTERGYFKLSKIMDDPMSWEVYRLVAEGVSGSHLFSRLFGFE